MARENGTVHVFCWTEVSFPLWQEPRPQFEDFLEVQSFIQKHIPWGIRSNYADLLDSGYRGGWLRWQFEGPISEEVRIRIQEYLEGHFGREASTHFRWAGSKASTTIESIFALGSYIQSGTQPC